MLDSLPTIGGRFLTGNSFDISEILQRSYHIHADEPPERLADRGCRPGFIYVLYGIEVDG